jgi:hypothetical protein
VNAWTPDWYTTTKCRLLVGDSITYRGETSPAYPQDLLESDPTATVGSFADNTSYAPFPYWSEGHGGYTTTMLLSSLATWKLSWRRKPTVAVILAGINDIAGANGEVYSQATTLANHAAIESLILGVSPACIVYHGLLIPLAAPYLAYDANRVLLNAAIVAAYPTRHIDFTVGFNAATMLVDGLHPNATGAALMASIVLAAGV